jgi:hypothetical protein
MPPKRTAHKLAVPKIASRPAGRTAPAYRQGYMQNLGHQAVQVNRRPSSNFTAHQQHAQDHYSGLMHASNGGNSSMPFGDSSNGSIPFDQLTAGYGGNGYGGNGYGGMGGNVGMGGIGGNHDSDEYEHDDSDSDSDDNFRRAWEEAAREVAEKNARIARMTQAQAQQAQAQAQAQAQQAQAQAQAQAQQAQAQQAQAQQAQAQQAQAQAQQAQAQAQAQIQAQAQYPLNNPATRVAIFPNAKPDNFVPFSGTGITLGRRDVQTYTAEPMHIANSVNVGDAAGYIHTEPDDTNALVEVNKWKAILDEKLEMNQIFIDQLKDIETINQIEHINYEIFEPIEYTDSDNELYVEILQAQVDLVEKENSRLISIIEIFN